MNLILLSQFFAIATTEICIRFLKNPDDISTVKTIPGTLWRWSSTKERFEELQAVKLNDSAVCSVEMENDLRGKTIVTAVVFMKPYVLRKSNDKGVTGFVGDIWTTLEEALQFKSEYRTIYRRPGSSGSQALMNGQAHALLEATAIYSYTSGYYTYSTPITTNSYALFVQSAGTRISKWWYARIFSFELWITTCAFVVLITVMVLCMYHLKSTTCRSYLEWDDELSSTSFDLLFVLGGISGQGSTTRKIPTSWSLRLITLSFLLMGMLLSGSFSSTLTSFLAIRANSLPLNCLQDVARKRTHSLCVANHTGAYIHFTVNGSPRGELEEKWKGLINKDCPDMRNSSMLSSRLCEPDFAYLEAPDIFLPTYRKVEHKCRMLQIPETYWSLRIAFLHARSSPYKRRINILLTRLRSVGVLKRLEKKWISQGMDTLANREWSSTFEPVEYAHIQIAFLGFVLIATSSGLICILEIIWHRVRTRRIEPTTILLDAFDVRVLEAYRRRKLRNSRRRNFVFRRNSILM